MFELVCEALAGVLAARLLAGWLTGLRWAPEGDPLLVQAMRAVRPRVPSRTACVVLDVSDGRQRVRCGFNRCDPDTVFEIGSVTKVFTGLLLADAIERGELNSDTTIGQTWPELAGADAGRVTMGELARHRSGLPGSPLGRSAPLRLIMAAYLGTDPYRRLDLTAVVRIAARARLRDVGVERYSNLGAALTGHAVARHAGTDYATLLTRRITGPLGMSSTAVDPDRRRPAGRGWLGSWTQPWRLDGYGPAGAITSTLEDMVELCRGLLAGSCPGAAALDEPLFWQVHRAADGRRRIWHNGETGGYSAYLAVYPESAKAVVVLAAHADARQQERLAGACMRSVS